MNVTLYDESTLQPLSMMLDVDIRVADDHHIIQNALLFCFPYFRKLPFQRTLYDCVVLYTYTDMYVSQTAFLIIIIFRNIQLHSVILFTPTPRMHPVIRATAGIERTKGEQWFKGDTHAHTVHLI